jgi:lysophospholipase L1-like esterase
MRHLPAALMVVALTLAVAKGCGAGGDVPPDPTRTAARPPVTIPPVTAPPATTVVFAGDSITAFGWYTPLVDTILPATAGPTARVNAINSGVPQNKVADIEGSVSSRITSYDPSVLVLEVGVNDCRGLNTGRPTPLATFRASYDNILATTQVSNPTVKIVCIGILLVAEHWSATPSPQITGNPYDEGSTTPSIDDYNAEIAASCAAHGGSYVDVRGAAAVAESTMNTPAPGAVDGVLTLPGDGVHPTAAGQLVMSKAAAAAFIRAVTPEATP